MIHNGTVKSMIQYPEKYDSQQYPEKYDSEGYPRKV